MNSPQNPQPPAPTSGFEFPPSLYDKIDANLKAGINPERPRLESVRPERRKQIIPELQEQGQASSPVSQQQASSPQVEAKAQVAKVVASSRASIAAGVQPFLLDNPHPPVTPVSTAEYTSLDLPSKFAYYPFKDLYVKPFRVPHLAKLAKANDVDSMQLVCEVVSSVLMTPEGHKNIGFGLSVNDFNAILYWLRANSFEKKTMRVTSQCGNPEHHKKVIAKELSEKTLLTESSHDVSKLVTSYLDRLPDPDVYNLTLTLDGGETRRVDLRPETMMDAIEMLDDPRLIDEEFQYMARIASQLDLDTAFPITKAEEGAPKRWTLQNKIKVVEEYLTNDQAMLVLQFSDLVDEFGVNEMVDVKCKECGHEEQIKLTIDARTFSAPRF